MSIQVEPMGPNTSILTEESEGYEIEACFFYTTLIGARFKSSTPGSNALYMQQRDGKAGSPTTARRLSTWLERWGRDRRDAKEVASEKTLNDILEILKKSPDDHGIQGTTLWR